MTETIQTGGSSLASLLFTGSGSWSFVDSNVTATQDVTMSSGTTTLPTGTFTIGGSFTNAATFMHSSGTVLFNATTTGKTISPGNSWFYATVFNSATGGWTISGNATTSSTFTLTNASTFTLSSGANLSVGGSFTNSVGGASTTWAGSFLNLQSGTSFAINTKTGTGDEYGTLVLSGTTTPSMWNSSSTAYTISTPASLYSQDHAGVDGDLYIYGAYVRTSGTEYWSAATDFDGTSLAGSPRQVDVRFDSGASATFNSSSTLQILGTSTASTTIARIATGNYGITVATSTINAQFYDFKHMDVFGLNITGSSTVTSLNDGAFEVSVASGTAMTVSSSTIGNNPAAQISRVSFTTTLSTSTPAGWMAGWNYRKSHTITSASGAGTNYQVKLTLYYGAGTDSGANVYLNSRSRTDFGDIRFTSSDGTTLIDYWVSSSTSGSSEDVWVEIPANLSTTSQSIYVYYGNVSASYPYLGSERAQGDATFLFFDDFSVDLSRWNREIINGVYPYLSSTTSPDYVRIGGGITSGNYGFNSLGSSPTYNTFNNNALGFKARNATDGIGSIAFRGSATSTNTGYQARFDQRTGQGQSFLRPPYSGWNFLGSCTVDASPPSANVWYIYDVTASTSNFSLYRNGALRKSCTDATHASPGQISLQNHYGSYTDYDWVFVRKFQGTEPGQGAWGAEELIPLSSGYNVTEVGTSTSFWRFRDHTGALAGEIYDNDPGGDPGYIRWDDSNVVITISGVVYADEALTPLGSPTCDNSTPNVKIVVDGGASYTGSCNSATGAYSIGGVVVPGDPVLTAFLNTNGGVKATTITRTPTQNITNFNLYANRVIVRNEDISSSMTIAKMAVYDETNDTDIRFDAATSSGTTLTVRPDTELHIATSTTFVPGGAVTLQSSGSGSAYDGSLHIDDNAIFTGAGTTTYSIGGRLSVDAGATFTAASSTVVMTATTTGKSIVTPSPQSILSIIFRLLVSEVVGLLMATLLYRENFSCRQAHFQELKISPFQMGHSPEMVRLR